MTTADGAGWVRLAGGDPSRLRSLLHVGRSVEVCTDLVAVTREQWTLFQDPRVRLATSWYSDDPAEHDAITDRPGSYARARENLIIALGIHVPVRVLMVEVRAGQRIAQGRAELLRLGVRASVIRVDRVRCSDGAKTRSANGPEGP
ncbi:hypothetical protein [Embleya sp. NPDC059259]|uniref:hypothetical protein n=1 Tax=unclassified Embleya TaxID=2699296 RepID=UPI003691F3E7